MPVTVSVLSLVILSVGLPVSWLTLTTLGATGALVSIVQVPRLVAGLVFPAASVAVTVSGCWPSANGLVVIE